MGRWTDGVRREVLDNGLTILVSAQASAPVAAVVTHVKAGFFDEPDRWAGVSHVLEHMFFKGTPTRGVGRIAQETKAAGGYLNAGTSYDYTVYYVVLPSHSLEIALDVQSDALLNSVVDEGELLRELEVIVQEANRKLDSPGAVTVETLFATMYDHHRIRRWRIGHEDHLRQLSRDDIWGYYRSRYVPRNTIVSVVGDFDPDVVLAQVRERYAGWSDAPPAVDPSPIEWPREGVHVRTLRGDVSQAHLALGWRTVPPLHPDETALELGAAVLSSGRASWLYRTLRASGIVSSVAAYNFAPSELGLFGIGLELDPSKTGEALTRIGQALTRMADEGPSNKDLERARTLLLTRWARQFEPMDGRASALAAGEALRDIAVIDEQYQWLQETTTRDVQEAFQRYVDFQTVSAVTYLPDAAAEDLDADRLVEVLASGNRTVVAVDHELPVTIGPAIHIPIETASEAAVARLGGADLVLRRKLGVPTVTLGVFGRRSPLETPADAGLSALAVRSAIRGAGGFDAAALADGFERRGGAVSPRITGDIFGFSCTVLADEAPAAAALLRAIIDQPAMESEEVIRERDVMVEEARRRTDDMFRYPMELAFGAAFDHTSYGVPAAGTPESLASFDAADVPLRYRELLAGTRLAIVAVGDLDPQVMADQLAGIFHDHESEAPALGAAADASVDWTTSAPVVTARERTQTALARVYPGPNRHDEDRSAAEVWSAIAGGLGGRLFEVLRSQRSLAYTVMSSSWQRRMAGSLVTYIATSPEREEEAREGLLEELERFRKDPATAEELAGAINYLVGQREVARQSSVSVADEILDAWLIGGGLDELVDSGRRFRAVTAEMVQDLCYRYLERDRGVEGIVRGIAGG
jgi:zinc protease